MTNVLPALAACAVPILLIAGFMLVERNSAARRAAYRAEAEQQFLNYTVQSTNSKLRFDGRSATVVWEEEVFRERNDFVDYSLTRFATNPAGEYFMFLSRPDSKPFFKHVEHRIARIKLKDRYVAPQSEH